jgi:hypothetical protein
LAFAINGLLIHRSSAIDRFVPGSDFERINTKSTMDCHLTSRSLTLEIQRSSSSSETPVAGNRLLVCQNAFESQQSCSRIFFNIGFHFSHHLKRAPAK